MKAPGMGGMVHFCARASSCFFSAGEDRVPGQVARMVPEVSIHLGARERARENCLQANQVHDMDRGAARAVCGCFCATGGARSVCGSVCPRMPSLIYAREGGRRSHVIPF